MKYIDESSTSRNVVLKKKLRKVSKKINVTSDNGESKVAILISDSQSKEEKKDLIKIKGFHEADLSGTGIPESHTTRLNSVLIGKYSKNETSCQENNQRLHRMLEDHKIKRDGST